MIRTNALILLLILPSMLLAHWQGICGPPSYSTTFGNRIDGLQVIDTIYQTYGVLESIQDVRAPAQVTYDAGQSVELQGGFEVEQGGILSMTIGGCVPDSIRDMTTDLVLLGNAPAMESVSGRGRNIWDLQEYNGQIYVGYGSTVENTGPTELFCYNPITDTLKSSCLIGTEAIERLRRINDTLFVPNSDPKPGDQLKFTYVIDNVCTDVSSVHKLAHVRDMFFYDGQYYLVGNSRCPDGYSTDCSGIIAMSSSNWSHDNGLLESLLTEAAPYRNSRWNWFFGLIEIDGNLVIPNAMFTEYFNPNLVLEDNLFMYIENDSLRWSALEPEETRLKHQHFYPAVAPMPGTDDTLGLLTSLRITEHLSIGDKTLYTLRTYSMFSELYHSAYGNSRGLMIKDSLRSNAIEVVLPDPEMVGEDLLKINGEAYVLANKKIDQDTFVVGVFKSTNPTAQPDSWHEILRFTHSNMARSFEFYQGFFYFGMGNNYGDSLTDAGQLIQVDSR